MIKIAISIILVLIISGCSQSKFSITPSKERIILFKLNGYYYDYVNINDKREYDHFYNIYFFYSNGVAFTPPISFDSLHKLNSIENALQQGDYKELAYIRSSKTQWGVYNIAENIITMQFHEAAPGIPIATSKLKILNDSTLIFLEFNSMKKTISYTNNSTIHFKRFDNKPDSTNMFIKLGGK